jgi:hypothetical protein
MAWKRACGWTVVGIAAALSVAGALLAGTAAMAAPGDSDSEDSSTWSVRPSDGEGHDGRTWAELTLDPGEEATDRLVVDNYSDHDITFALAAADGVFTEAGHFTVLPGWQESTDAGLWIDLPKSVEVPAHEAAVVAFTVHVPRNASPGDHPAGVVASLAGESSGQGVTLNARVGFRVMVRVTGEFEPALQIEAQARYAMAWNPFSPGSLTVDYTVTNTGNLRLGVSPAVRARPWVGLSVAKAGDQITEFAPGDSRSGTVTLRRVWPWGLLNVEVNAEGRLIVDQPGIAPPVTSTTVRVVAIPWPQLVLILAAAGLFLAWRRGRRRRERVLRQLLDEAHQRGLREAAAGQDPPATGDTSDTTAGDEPASGQDDDPDEPEKSDTPPEEAAPQRRRPRHAVTKGAAVALAALTAAGLALCNARVTWAEPSDIDDQGVDLSVVIGEGEEYDWTPPPETTAPPTPSQTTAGPPSSPPPTGQPPTSSSAPPTSPPPGDEELEWTGTSHVTAVALVALALMTLGWALRRRARLARPE